MKTIEQQIEIFRGNIVKVAGKLGMHISNISRDKYRQVVKEMSLPYVDLYFIGGYTQNINNILNSDSSKEDYSSLFCSSMREISRILSKDITEITRDEYISIGKQNEISVLGKHRISELGGFATLKNKLFKSEIEQYNKKKFILSKFHDYVLANSMVPTLNEFKSFCDIKGIYQTIEEIEEDAKSIYSDIDYNLLNENSFTEEYRKTLEDKIKDYNKFVITTAVSNKKVNKNFLKSLKNYAERNNAMVLVIPCEDVWNRKSPVKWQLDPKLKDFGIVFKDTYLNNNVYVSTIKISAKQILPTTGLDAYSQLGTAIIASPKQDLRFVANNRNRIPNAIMTTGAITESDYSADAYMSHRLNKIAEYDHVTGAIIVEVQDKEIFHFRQIQAGAGGEIIDLNSVYYPNGKIENANGTVMIIGDSHFGEHDSNVVSIEKDMINRLSIKDIVMHDIFSATSISHHDKNKTIVGAIKAEEGKISLEAEANMVANMLDEFADITPNNVIIVNSNHHEHLGRYLEEGRYAFDKVNLRYSLDIVKAMIDGETLPLKFMLENQTSFKNKDKVVWLEQDEPYNFYGVEVSLHGHLGANGSRGNLRTYRKTYKSSMSAHSHTPQIHKGNYCVGTSTKKYLGYNNGLSSWVAGVGLIHSNGTKQLINIIPDSKNNYSWRI